MDLTTDEVRRLFEAKEKRDLLVMAAIRKENDEIIARLEKTYAYLAIALK